MAHRLGWRDPISAKRRSVQVAPQPPPAGVPASQYVAGFLASVAVFVAPVGIIYYPGRVAAGAILVALIASAMGGFQSRLAAFAVGFSTLCWLAVTMVTPPEPEAHLVAFYRRVRPGGPGWRSIARLAGDIEPEPLGGLVIDWIAGTILIYAMLFGIGETVLGSYGAALACFAVAAAAVVIIWRDLSRRGWRVVT